MDSRIFDSLLEPIFILNQECRVIYCNDPAALLCNGTPRKIARQKPIFSELLKFSNPIEALADISGVSDPSPYQEVSFTTENGKNGRLQITVQKLSAEPEATWVLFCRDVTLEEILQRKYRAELDQKEDVIRDLEKAQAQLEEYSKNLEKMVAERTRQLSEVNLRMSALLDSLGQGFLIFDSKGKCLDIASRACERILENDPRGKPLSQVLGLPAAGAVQLEKWMQTLFGEMLPFEDLAFLGPNTFKHSQGLDVQISYYPIRNETGKIDGVVLVATDISDLVKSQKAAQKEKQYVQTILQIVRNRRQIMGFLSEAREISNALYKKLVSPALDDAGIFRDLHTLKGGAASYGLFDMAERIHEAENTLDFLRDEATGQVKAENLKKLQTEAQYYPEILDSFIKENHMLLGVNPGQAEPLKEVRQNDIREHLQSLPLGSTARHKFFDVFVKEPIHDSFIQFDEQVRAIANSLGKGVNPLVIEGGEYRIWNEPYKSLIGTFIHAFRNSLDHGIENYIDREQANKNPLGTVGIKALVTEGLLQITIWDDGRGIDTAKIRKIKSNLGLNVSKLTDFEIGQMVFESQFSTSDQVTDLSGRGVGMDAILYAAKALGGRAWVESEPGQGTRVQIEVPEISESDTGKPVLKVS